MARSGELWSARLGASPGRVAAGFGLGAVLRAPCWGSARDRPAPCGAVGNPLIAATYPIPKIALLPLIILWLGIGETPKVVMIALGVFFPVVINAHAGVRGTDPLMVKAAKSLGAGPRQVIFKVVVAVGAPHDTRGLPARRGHRAPPRGLGGDDQCHDRHRLPHPELGRPDAHREADGGPRHVVAPRARQHVGPLSRRGVAGPVEGGGAESSNRRSGSIGPVR